MHYVVDQQVAMNRVDFARRTTHREARQIQKKISILMISIIFEIIFIGEWTSVRRSKTAMENVKVDWKRGSKASNDDVRLYQ